MTTGLETTERPAEGVSITWNRIHFCTHGVCPALTLAWRNAPRDANELS